MSKLIDDLKNKGLMEEENIGFDQVFKHINRALKDLKAARANLSIDSEVSYNYSYDEAGILVSEQEMEKALENAEGFVKEVVKFIQDKNPQKKLP